MAPCPSPETLGRLACPSPFDTQFEAMEAHVEACPVCQGVVERLAASSSACADREPERLPPRERPPAIPGFVIERELGRGGMGVVYQAWQPQLARRVAIKVVSASLGIDAEARRRWLREAQAIGRVRHRNVVQLHEVGDQDGCLYLVLDLITGGSLADHITGPLPGRVAARLVATIARAVEHIHESGMLHLDIKPANILLDGPPDGAFSQATPMIADFGIARAGDDPTATATGLLDVRGTPSFMAPEQIAGASAAIGPRTDVYSLGATLYCLLTGRPPFQAASVIETLDLVRTREPAGPRTLVPGVPRDLETITLVCLRKDPMRRYASARALAADLERWLDGFPIEARPVSKLEHARRWCRRRPAIAALLTVLAFTVASSLVGLFSLWRRSEIERVRAEDALALSIASDQATSRAVRDLIGLLGMSVYAPQSLAEERVTRASRVVLDLTAKLRQERGFAASNLVAICGLERLLANDLQRRARFDESRALLNDSLELLAGQRRLAHDPEVDDAYAQTLIQLGWMCGIHEQYDETLDLFQRAEQVLQGLADDARNLDIILSIDETRRAIAWLFGRKGLNELRRRLLESHIQMLEDLTDQAGGDRAIALLAKLARSDLAVLESGRAPIRLWPHRFAAHKPISERFEWRVADWIAEDIERDSPEAHSKLGPPGHPEPDAHAHAVIMAIESRCKALGVYPAMFPAAAYQVAGFDLGSAYEQRRAGRLEDARRTVACLFAFGKILAKREPEEAVYHLILTIAFEQESKNAWKIRDYAAIEAALRKAFGEASIALRLDPENADARLKVSGLQDKLIRLASERP